LQGRKKKNLLYSSEALRMEERKEKKNVHAITTEAKRNQPYWSKVKVSVREKEEKNRLRCLHCDM
jgi:hypothetical protein